MQILQNLIASAIIAPFLSITTLVASLATPDPISAKSYTWNLNYKDKNITPDCATPPTVFESLPYDFWIEAIPLDPIDYDFEGLPENPLHLKRGDQPFSGVRYNSLNVAETYQARAGFVLRNKFLENSDGEQAVIWPNSLSYLGFDDSNPLVFNPNFGENKDESSILADFTAVKSCTSDNSTELRLRGQRRFGDNKGVFVFGSSPFLLY